MADRMEGGAHRRTPRSEDRSRAAARTRASGTRFATAPSHARGEAHRAPATGRSTAHAHARHRGVQPVYRRRRPARRAGSRIAPIVGVIVAAAVVAVLAFVVVPAVRNAISGGSAGVEAGVEVQVSIPQGASGDQIASILSQNHIIENPKDYYAAVRSLQADAQLKPGDYLFKTLQDPEEVVQQLIDGPNVEGVSLTIPEGLTVEQTAQHVEQTYGISADEFLAQAKASNYEGDYSFLKDAYNDSLEGYLYPKTYTFADDPTADDIIRAMLDQFVKETSKLSLDDGPDGLTSQQIITLASLVERESSIESERPEIASVIYNRLDAGMPLQIDAAIVYARGGGTGTVTYDDLEIDSPYNVYKNTGLTPGPICSPSISSIEAALEPADTNYLYYVLSASCDGTHVFSETYDEFLENRQAYLDSRS